MVQFCVKGGSFAEMCGLKGGCHTGTSSRPPVAFSCRNVAISCLTSLKIEKWIVVMTVVGLMHAPHNTIKLHLHLGFPGRIIQIVFLSISHDGRSLHHRSNAGEVDLDLRARQLRTWRIHPVLDLRLDSFLDIFTIK